MTNSGGPAQEEREVSAAAEALRPLAVAAVRAAPAAVAALVIRDRRRRYLVNLGIRKEKPDLEEWPVLRADRWESFISFPE